MREAVRHRQLIEILHDYEKGPLSAYLSLYFKQNRQIGSKDRKALRELIYNTFRIWNSLDSYELNYKIAFGNYILNPTNKRFVEYLLKELKISPTLKWPSSLDERVDEIKKLLPSFSLNSLFPFIEKISSKLDSKEFIKRHLQQPPLFLRLFQNNSQNLEKELLEHNISFSKESDKTLVFKNARSLNHLKSYQRGEVEVMDWASQHSLDNLKQVNGNWWDCCAGGGGKTLLLKQKNEDVNLLSTDIRIKPLKSLRNRVLSKGFREIKIKELDVLNDDIGPEQFDGILLDAPCSGSGTWNRTPENLKTFSLGDLEKYKNIQASMLEKLDEKVKPGGKLVYLTCSAYSSENEEQIDRFLSNHSNYICRSQDYVFHSGMNSEIIFSSILEKQY